MEDEAYQLKRQENLRNPKNRFLGVFCHAEQVDSAWGCDWSFQCGVIFFSIIILACSFFDVYEIASNKIFSSAYSGGHQFFFGLKVFSDIINFIGIILGCIAVGYMNLKYSIISYYVAVLSLILNTIFFIYLFVAIFISWSKLMKIYTNEEKDNKSLNDNDKDIIRRYMNYLNELDKYFCNMS